MAIRRIYLYGNSVILGTLEASLRRYSQCEVTVLVPPLPGSQELATLKPDVVIFDLQTAQTEAVFSLLEGCPGLLLIGVNPDRNVVKVWTGRQLRELSTNDLLKVIDGQMNELNVF
jgi:hypothetical protein